MTEMEKKNCIEIQESPLRSIFCLKRKDDMKRFDEIYDCFILDFDPVEPLQCISTLPYSDELSVVGEKGQVACRDFPHPRHLCLKHPFEKTPHDKFCPLCYCYVCDSAAPCCYWKIPNSAHCHATDQSDDWKLQRNMWRAQGHS